MKKTETAKIASNGRVKIFTIANDAALLLITLYAAIKASFNLHMSQMADAVQKLEEDIKVWAQTKKLSKRKMAECIIKFALRPCVQADQLH